MPAEAAPPAGAAPRRAAVLGHPIDHSLSPVLHRAAYAVLGLGWTYDAVDMTSERLAGFLDSLDPSWAGLSLTMPLKQSVLALLDEIDPLAVATGAANTVVLEPGRRRGFNTDVAGILAALDECGARIGPSTSAAVLGAGATARSALAALARRGCVSVTAYARRPDGSDALSLRTTAEALGLGLAVAPWTSARQGLGCDVVVSIVPVGGADALVSALPTHPGALLDVVYAPWPTALARGWVEHGGRVASGLDLLLFQAVEQVRLMTGLDAPVGAMREALASAARTR